MSHPLSLAYQFDRMDAVAKAEAMMGCPVRRPENFIMHEGQRFVEVEWPADGRYDIGYQLAKETERPGIGRYMGLFELASRKLRRVGGNSDG